MMKDLEKIKSVSRVFLLLVLMITFSACEDEDEQLISLDVNGQTLVEDESGEIIFDEGDDFFGDIDGDFEGFGEGSASVTFYWMNLLPVAEYSADITATSSGRFNMMVSDAENQEVLNRSLRGDREPDSMDGLTKVGAVGLWSVTITLESFTGDGSFSMSSGD